MSQGVLLTKKSPHTILIIGVAMVELHGFQLCKLLYQRLINHQPLISVPSRCLVFMLADSLLQKLRHHEIRIAEQGRNAHHRSQHLGEERAAAVAQKQVGLLPVDDGANLLQCLLWVQGGAGVSTTAVPSNASFKALAIGQLPVAKNPCRNNIFFML